MVDEPPLPGNLLVQETSYVWLMTFGAVSQSSPLAPVRWEEMLAFPAVLLLSPLGERKYQPFAPFPWMRSKTLVLTGSRLSSYEQKAALEDSQQADG